MRFSWSSHLSDIFRVITPSLTTKTTDPSGTAILELEFKHRFDHFGGVDEYTLKVQISTDGGENWDTKWSIIPNANIGPETVKIELGILDVPSFQIAWVLDGDRYYINYWYIDDIVVDYQ